MPDDLARSIQFDDQESGRLHAVWSRSGKHLIVTVATQRWENPKQVELRADQVGQFAAFLRETVGLDARDR
jgi:hypothetical protein